jgi:glucose-1-phosphate cytidylyltransferase
MVEIGGKPILWHIMKIYSYYGIDDFIVCLGYKGYIIKEYFANYFLHQSNVTIDFKENKVNILESKAEPWTVTLVDTGENSMTGGRIKKIRSYVEDTFMLTYGDGVSDVNLEKLLERHRASGKHVSVTAVQPTGRFGALSLDESDNVKEFQEKPKGDGAWINGGFFVAEPAIFDYIEGDNTIWEKGPLEHLSRDGQVAAFKHRGFWQPMDTLRDKKHLEDLWDSGNAPWALWLKSSS